MRKAVFAGRDYKPDPPSAYVMKLIGADDPDGIYLAQTIKEIEHFGHLLGSCIEATPNRATELWVIRGSSHQLIYCFFRERREIWYLIAFNGDFDDNLKEAKLRLRSMQN
jgi:hypothetical protein